MALLRTIQGISFCAVLVFALPESYKPPTGRADKLCYNGKQNFKGECICDLDFSGKLCERRKHCATFDRHANYSCIECKEGWTGSECDFIHCENGVPKSATECECDEPYSGEYCTQLKTTDVYLYYNRAIYSMGPLGVLSIIPLILILIGCERLSKRRQLKQAEEAMEEQLQHDVSSEIVEVLISK